MVPPPSAAPCWTPREWRQVDGEVTTEPTREHRATDAPGAGGGGGPGCPEL